MPARSPMSAASAREDAHPPTPGRALSVVFLTYNRADLLALAVESLKPALATLHIPTELIVSDDCSDQKNRRVIEGLPVDRRIWSDRNRGLSHNHNAALAACRFEYILSLQDDWRFVGPANLLASCIELLEREPEVGQVNLMPPSKPLPCVMRSLPDGGVYMVFENDLEDRDRGGAERPYSDRPHVKRRAFIDQLGPYREDLPMTRAELDFQRRVANQRRWKVAYLVADPPFQHLGAERTFNPSNLRQARIERLQAIPILGISYSWLRTVAKALVRHPQ